MPALWCGLLLGIESGRLAMPRKLYEAESTLFFCLSTFLI